MLSKLREKTSGWIAGVVLGLLTIPFAFFGMEQYMTQSTASWVAAVEAPPSWWAGAPHWWPASMLWQREEISADEFRTRFEQERQQARAEQGDAFESRAFEEPANKRLVVDRMVDSLVVRMMADRAGIAISDAQVRRAIREIPAFQVDGKFDPKQYQLALASQVPQRTPRQFEDLLRSDLQRAMIPQAIAASGFATAGEVDHVLRLMGEKRDVAFAVIPAPAPDTGAVDAAGIQAWYDSHAAAYRSPETVTLEYVEIDAGQLPAPEVDEAALRQRYEDEKLRFGEPEQRLASHILVQVPKDADAAAQAAAKAEAEKLAVEAKAPGADFAALARAQSDDNGTAASGGDLGWVSKDMVAEPFADALFAMQPGDVVGPVKTDFGWHVIQLRDVKAGRTTPFEEVRDQLVQEQQQADRERAFNELASKLVDQVYKNPTSLAPAAESAGLEVKRVGPVQRGAGSGIFANAAVQRAAFSEALIEDGTVSDPIEIAPGHSVLLRVVGHEPERQRPLSEVADQVIAAVRHDRAAKAAEKQADDMVAAVRGGKTLKEVADARGVEAAELAELPRGMPVPSPQAAEAIFAAPAPEAGKKSVGKVVLGDGRIVVYAVRKVIPGDPAEATDEQREMLRQQLAQVHGNQDVDALVQALRRQVRVEVAEERL